MCPHSLQVLIEERDKDVLEGRKEGRDEGGLKINMLNIIYIFHCSIYSYSKTNNTFMEVYCYNHFISYIFVGALLYEILTILGYLM